MGAMMGRNSLLFAANAFQGLLANGTANQERLLSLAFDSDHSNATGRVEERFNSSQRKERGCCNRQYQSNGATCSKPISYSPWRMGRIHKLARMRYLSNTSTGRIASH